jgi:hypothetical protein
MEVVLELPTRTIDPAPAPTPPSPTLSTEDKSGALNFSPGGSVLRYLLDASEFDSRTLFLLRQLTSMGMLSSIPTSAKLSRHKVLDENDVDRIEKLVQSKIDKMVLEKAKTAGPPSEAAPTTLTNPDPEAAVLRSVMHQENASREGLSLGYGCSSDRFNRLTEMSIRAEKQAREIKNEQYSQHCDGELAHGEPLDMIFSLYEPRWWWWKFLTQFLERALMIGIGELRRPLPPSARALLANKNPIPARCGHALPPASPPASTPPPPPERPSLAKRPRRRSIRQCSLLGACTCRASSRSRSSTTSKTKSTSTRASRTS